MDEELKKYAWSVKLDHEFKEKQSPFTFPRLKQALGFIPLSLRYLKYHIQCKLNKQEPYIDMFNPLKCQQIYGCPIGGIGSGTIGRSFKGDFCRYQLVAGIYEHQSVEANMFTVCIRKKCHTVYQQALTTKRAKLKGFKSWNMAYCGEHATYYALYPDSWTVYELPGQNVRLTCHQLSPIIPHNYKDSSLPTACFNWTIDNLNDEDIELSLMFTWSSGSASDRFETSDVKSDYYEYEGMESKSSGVFIEQKLNGNQLTYVLAAKETPNVSITKCCQFYPEYEQSGSYLWMDLLNDGQLNNHAYSTNYQPNKKAKLAVAICVKVRVKAQSSENINFSLVWHMPKIKFLKGTQVYDRFYTKHFENNETSAFEIAHYALNNYLAWIKAIGDWRQPILNDTKLTKWYKCALFNELYFMSDGGTVWIDAQNDKSVHATIQEYGRFAYLEGHEYRMFNTYDVHFYASFALLMLWPKLQLSMQYDYADAVPKEFEPRVPFLYDGEISLAKAKNCVPHDLGDPENDPWTKINAYISHDTKDWVDLNLKFILQVYRDYYYLNDLQYLKDMWPVVKILMESIQKKDHDGDGLIDSLGRPDQTYDAWSVTGASAYCGGLHLAVLKSVTEMCKKLNESECLETYTKIYEQAKQAYHTKLWNGSYFKYDSSKNSYNDSIMADMCCGHWFLRSSGFKYEVFDKQKIDSCLNKIYDFNIIKFGNCKYGAVNGMRPDGKVDITSMQSEEVWIGVTDSLAALMIYEGMNDKAWSVIEGLYNLCYNDMGLAFQMPEAIIKKNKYRSLGYMRALCIWSIQYAIDNLKKNDTIEDVKTF